ncbi:sensor histidine kinase [Foetidibacter luteolus]|uniref:sensor histidine kinase n=1 Tax=Foetidibacter luteolus TaxID=2608880 RepID=UPI00129BF902|nr:response regulator [Foetidibacter luteolus]
MLTSANKEFTVLLVDDREENLVSLEEILNQENRIFLKARSGNEALKLVLKHENIGLIMLDVQMPDMDGFEVAKLLKSNSKTRDISIIFVTAINKEEQYVLKGFEYGAVDYLQKPLDINVTKAKVNVFERLYFYQGELKHTVNEVEKVNKQLERFVYIVSHDIKSPLSSIITMLSLLEEDHRILKDNELQSKIEMLSQASLHLSGMIGSILDYSRKSMSQQTIEEVDVQELVLQTAYLLFPPKHITISVNDDLPVIYTRKLKLQQVFQNLLGNAIKYNNKAQGHIQVGYNDRPSFHEFYVKDNGAGIPEKDQDSIFKLFHVTNNQPTRESATGIGLNILKMLVEEQGGKIWVESNYGEGSTFFFEWSK